MEYPLKDETSEKLTVTESQFAVGNNYEQVANVGSRVELIPP